MRELIIKLDAESAIRSVANYIESINLPGSSFNWMMEITDFINHQAQLNISYRLCKSRRLAKRKFSCLIFNKKWVIAFKQTRKQFVVHQIIYGPKLN